jgi:hypothetical protein
MAEGYFPENQFDEREKSFRQTSKNAVSLAQVDLGYWDSAGKGIEPLPVGLGREGCDFTRDRPSRFSLTG